jgi:hypothetical protein
MQEIHEESTKKKKPKGHSGADVEAFSTLLETNGKSISLS